MKVAVAALSLFVFLAGCQTVGQYSDDWVPISKDHRRIEIRSPYEKTPFNVKAQATAFSYRELWTYKDSEFEVELFAGFTGPNRIWLSVDSAVEFKKQAIKYFDLDAVAAAVPNKIATADAFGWYLVTQRDELNCVFSMLWAAKSFGDDDGRYRVLMAGSVCTMNVIKPEDADKWIGAVHIKRPYYNGNGIVSESQDG